MPTYDYKCAHCDLEVGIHQSISQYVQAPRVPSCANHGAMERKLSVVPSSGLANALAGDRHYEGLRGPNGEDISSRTKHREFMKATGLTTHDDFAGEFRKKEAQRQEFREAKHEDKELRSIITEKVMTAVAQPD